MSDRPEAKELETYPFDLTELPVGTKITDNLGVERIIRQHFTDPAGPYTWMTQARRTSRGQRYDRDGRCMRAPISGVLRLETAVLPAKVDGEDINLLWLPVGTRFRDGRGTVHELDEVRPADQSYPLVTVNGRTWTATGRYYGHSSRPRRKHDDIVISSIVLPKRQRLPIGGEVPLAAVTVKATVGEPAPAFTEPKPEPQPEPQPEDKTITDINQLNSWEW